MAEAKAKEEKVLPEKYIVGDKEFTDKNLADQYQAKLDALNAQVDEQIALAPDKHEFIQMRERMVLFRNNLREMPMNETHMPDGSLNPMYDRNYYYAWGSIRAGSIGDMRAFGYQLVSMDDLKELINLGKCPDFYLNILREEGSYLVFGEDILMRIPRVVREETVIAPKRQRALERIQKVQDKSQETLTNAGARIRNQVEDKVTIDFR